MGGSKGREGGSREGGSKDATQARSVSGGREGGLMMGTSEEGTGRGMGGGRDCARKGWSKGARK